MSELNDPDNPGWIQNKNFAVIEAGGYNQPGPRAALFFSSARRSGMPSLAGTGDHEIGPDFESVITSKTKFPESATLLQETGKCRSR
jgi:hypothetical protein